MTLTEVMQLLESMANPSAKQTYLRHGAKEPLFGVRFGDLKLLQKKLKGQQELALELYKTKNSDAMYLAGLIADGSQMTRKQLDLWVHGASWHMLADYTVAWVASEHPDAIEIAQTWIDSPKELVAAAGWSTLASVVATVPDAELPISVLAKLLERSVQEIKSAKNRAKYAMNNYVICCGTYVAPLADVALAAAKKLGTVQVDMGDTDCKVPQAETYIIKCRRGGQAAPKRKNARC